MRTNPSICKHAGIIYIVQFKKNLLLLKKLV